MMKVHPARAVGLASLTAGAGTWLANGARAAAAGPPSLETLVTAAVLGVGAAACAGLALLTLGSLAEALLGWRPRAAAALPAPLRRFVLGAVAAAVVAGVAVPAGAEEVSPGWAAASPSPTPAPASFSPAAWAPAAWAPAAVAQAVTTASARERVHVVVAGESLWSIAAGGLGSGASDAEIVRAWPLIYQANRSVVGDDPGLIRPGQHLIIPAGVPT